MLYLRVFTCAITHSSPTQINNVFIPAVGDRDVDDLRQNSSALFPPEYYVNYLSLPEVVSKIGAEAAYQECPNAPYDLFVKTGDVCRLKFSTADGVSELIMNGYALGRTNMAPSALRVGEFWIEDSNLGMRAQRQIV